MILKDNSGHKNWPFEWITKIFTNREQPSRKLLWSQSCWRLLNWTIIVTTPIKICSWLVTLLLSGSRMWFKQPGFYCNSFVLWRSLRSTTVCRLICCLKVSEKVRSRSVTCIILCIWVFIDQIEAGSAVIILDILTHSTQLLTTWLVTPVSWTVPSLLHCSSDRGDLVLSVAPAPVLLLHHHDTTLLHMLVLLLYWRLVTVMWSTVWSGDTTLLSGETTVITTLHSTPVISIQEDSVKSGQELGSCVHSFITVDVCEWCRFYWSIWNIYFQQHVNCVLPIYQDKSGIDLILVIYCNKK